MRIIDLTNQKLHRLTALEPMRRGTTRCWRCRCDCGREVIASTSELRSGKVKSCGCYKAALGADQNYIHGGVGTREYRIWKNMRTRCTNPKFKQWKDYGGRGIAVDPAWNDFARFIQDMGSCPPGWTIERKNNDLGYSRQNCRWATRADQNRNRRKRDTETPSMLGVQKGLTE